MGNDVFVKISGVMFFVFLIGIGTSLAADSTCYGVIKLVNQDPNPATPGSYVKILLEVSGVENPDCGGFALKLEPTYPFSLDSGYDPIQTLDGSTYIQGYKTAWVVPYKMRVADDALEGDYEIDLLYHQGSSRNFENSYATKTLNISIMDFQTSFDAVVQESSGNQVSLGIVNTGENTANSVIVKIPKQDNFRTSGISEQIVGNLVAGDYTIVSFTVSSATGGNRTKDQTSANTLKVQIDYTDGVGKRRSVTRDVRLETSSSQMNFTNVVGGSQLNSSTSSNSTLSAAAYSLGAVAVIAVSILVYRRYRKAKKGHSKDTPTWVSDDRAHKKK